MSEFERKPKRFNSLSPISMTDVLRYQSHEIGVPFIIDLKVPRFDDRFLDDHRHYTKSNINVCYAAPRTKGKARNWFETQLTVSRNVRSLPGYPDKGIPFFAVTDDGFGFLAHTTSDNNKQLAAIGDELILGKWKDTDRKGMITKEMLDAYGCNALAFQKTDLRIQLQENSLNSYEVWTFKLVWLEETE